MAGLSGPEVAARGIAFAPGKIKEDWMVARALYYTAPGQAEIRPVALPDLGEDWVEVETLYSAISRGTERLVALGRVPASETARMRAPHQEGEFPFPVKYGYAATGRVVAGPLAGREVFALYPHQTRFRVAQSWVVPLPPGVSPARGVLGANAETALNAIWDAALPPGVRVLVVGLGLLGCLVTAFLSLRPDLTVMGVDPVADRARVLAQFPVTVGLAPLGEWDVAIHTSATAAGLATALDALVFEGRVIELSWFGAGDVAVPLGGAFHSRRLTIQSSQVGHVAAPMRGTTTHAQRLGQALALLADPRFEAMVSEEVAFDAVPAAISRLLAPGAPGIATRIRY